MIINAYFDHEPEYKPKQKISGGIQDLYDFQYFIIGEVRKVYKMSGLYVMEIVVNDEELRLSMKKSAMQYEAMSDSRIDDVFRFTFLMYRDLMKTERDLQIIIDYFSGVQQNEIAKKNGISAPRVCKIIREFKLKSHKIKEFIQC